MTIEQALRLDAAELIAEAEQSTGLSAWGDLPFHDGLEVAVKSFNEEVLPRGLTSEGFAQERRDLLLRLQGRLRIMRDRSLHPEIAKEQIKRPIFIVGMQRTGTTHLHQLLSLDPGNRSPLTWEVLLPSPPPETATFDTDPRIARAARMMADSGLTNENFGAMHTYGATLPDECQHIFEFTFRSLTLTGRLQRPSYLKWLQQCDMVPAYQIHRMLLQNLQWHCPGERWVLKSPEHVIHIKELLQVYPDAIVVVTHRDPRKVIPSFVSLVTKLQKLCQRDVDISFEINKWLYMLPKGLAEIQEIRQLPQYRNSFIDVRFDDLAIDPVGNVTRIYGQAGLDLPAGLVRRIEAHLQENPRTKFGEHRYSMEEFGSNNAVIEKNFAVYMKQYGF